MNNRRLWVVVDAVYYEPVSGAEIPAKWENNRELVSKSRIWLVEADRTSAKPRHLRCFPKRITGNFRSPLRCRTGKSQAGSGKRASRWPAGLRSANERVGYKHPPMATRFKKGQSGNLAGRPKRQSSMKETVREVLQGRETVTVNGEQMSMATMEYLARQFVNEALRGDIGAIKTVLDADEAGDLLGAIHEQRRHPRRTEASRNRGGLGTTLRR